MKIILSGGGSGEKTKKLDYLFASLLDKNKPLLYIPIAIDKQKHTYSECLRWLKDTFNKFGINNYIMWTEEELRNIKDVPERFSGIYIGGGNTFYLLKTLKETKFWNMLKKFIKKGIPLYGGSAGAIIFGRTIATSSDENIVQLDNLKGMNLLRNISLFCHYKEENDEIIKKQISKNDLKKIIALPETTGIYITDGKKIIIGKESAHLFSLGIKKEIKVGEKF